LPDSGISCWDIVQCGYCTDRSIATCNQTCTRDVRHRFIENLRINAGRELDQRAVGSGEKGVGQGHNQMGQLPEAVEQT